MDSQSFAHSIFQVLGAASEKLHVALINNTVCVYVERAREQEQFENVRRIVRKSVRCGGGLYPNLYFFAKSKDDEAVEEIGRAHV